MSAHNPGLMTKMAWSLPWLSRYPFWRAGELMKRMTAASGERHLIFTVANHFEPSWDDKNLPVDLSVQMSRLDDWCEKARRIGEAVRDSDGTPFRHTNFYPAEQYHRSLLDRLAELQRDGFGEVEIHLHHGVERPDTEANLRRTLEEFRDTLAYEHQCLSRMDGEGQPMYAFVHGNWALANSAGGRFCGVDSEMQTLAETGCYADFTLPSVPYQTQVSRINAIYEAAGSFENAVPHRTGPGLKAGSQPRLPIIFTGPLVFDWSRRVKGMVVPRLDDGVLAFNHPLDLKRLDRWANARISIGGRPDWVFIKLYCHGFFPHDQETVIGDRCRRFFEEALEESERTGEYKIHFASAREAFNMAMAAVDRCEGEPGLYRDYRLQQIMQEASTQPAEYRSHELVEEVAGKGF
jgi:hypothetical protein